MLAVERERVQPGVGAVRHYHDGLGAARIDPDAVRAIGLAGLTAFARPGSDPLEPGAELVDVTQAVAVRHVDVAVRCHHRVAGLLINAGILGPVERPHSLAVQGGPDHHVALVIRKVEILAAAFLTQKAAVGLFLKSRSLGLDVLAFVIEDDDGVFAMVVDHELVVRSDLKAVGVTILDARLEDTPARDEFIGVRSAPERRLCCRTCSRPRASAGAATAAAAPAPTFGEESSPGNGLLSTDPSLRGHLTLPGRCRPHTGPI